MRAAAILLLPACAAWAGCVGDLRLDLPPLPQGTQALILAVDRRTSADPADLEVYAFEAEDFAAHGLRLDFDREPDALLSALFYATTLEALELPAGRLLFEGARPLPVPQASVAAELAGGSASPWKDAQPSERVRDFRIRSFDWISCAEHGGCADTGGDREQPDLCVLPCPAASVVHTPDAPVPPRAALPPRFDTACPAGWARALDDALGTEVCEPPPDLSCADGEAQLPGSSGCTLVGGPCAPDGWPSALPAGRTVIYVESSTTGGGAGSGTKSEPFASISGAIAISNPGYVIAVARGTYREPALQLPAGVDLIGACARDTQLILEPASGGTMIEAQGADIRVAALSLGEGAETGIEASGRDTSLTIEGVIARASVFGVRAREGATLSIRASSIGGFNAAGLEADSGAQCTARELAIQDASGIALSAIGTGTLLDVESARVRDMRDGLASGGAGLVATLGAQASLRGAFVERCMTYGAGANGATTSLSLEQLIVRDGAGNGELGSGVSSTGGAHVSLAESRVSGVKIALSALTGGELTVSDVALTKLLDAAEGEDAGGIGINGAKLHVSRVLISGAGRYGVVVLGGGTGELEDLIVRDSGLTPGIRRFVAVQVSNGSELTLSGASLENNGGGLFCTRLDKTAVISDVTVTHTHPPEAEPGASIAVTEASLDADRVRVEDSTGAAIDLFHSPNSVLRDLFVRSSGSSDPPIACVKLNNTRLMLERARIEACVDAGMTISGFDATTLLHASDLSIAGTGHEGIQAGQSTRLELSTVTIEHAGTYGLRAHDLLADDLLVDGSGNASGQTAGVELIESESITLERFRVRGSDSWGILFTPSLSLPTSTTFPVTRLTDGEISDNRVGLRIPAAFLERDLFERVRYEKNGIAVELVP